MKTHAVRVRTVVFTFVIGLALFVSGCGNAAQKKAYEQAMKAELEAPIESAATVIAEYKQVIALEPGSSWAKKAQTRIDAVKARVKAEELRKSVFHEHGID